MSGTTPKRYSVAIHFDAGEGSSKIAELMSEAFSTADPTLARPNAIRAENDHVVAEFHEVSDCVPTGPADSESPAGSEAVNQLKDLRFIPSTLVPTVRALLALSEARSRAGLSPRQRLIIEVNPEPPPGQERFDPQEDI
jgi:hypothetical protein